MANEFSHTDLVRLSDAHVAVYRDLAVQRLNGQSIGKLSPSTARIEFAQRTSAAINYCLIAGIISSERSKLLYTNILTTVKPAA